ncbi:MAG: endonuclease/exonuclease/phosphatase family protein [Candidatus Obscuribacterales bacterium]|nr:endonuclease/exonuclease/phosphatase family protein [Candidatus Obscuribacterales bacterium]
MIFGSQARAKLGGLLLGCKIAQMGVTQIRVLCKMRNQKKSLLQKMAKLLPAFLKVSFPALLLVSLVGMFSEYGWFFNLFSHFRVQYLLLFGLCALYYSCAKKPLQVFVALVFIAINTFEILPYISQSSHATNADLGRTKLRFMQMNVLAINKKYELIAKSIDDASPDVIAFEEMNQPILDGIKLHHALDKYPYSILEPNPFAHSCIALFSKVPIKSSSVEFAYGKLDPSIFATLDLGEDKELTVVAMHPRPPMSPVFLERQVRHFKFVADKRADFGPNLVLMGDLNTTPWATPFKTLLKRMELVDPRVGRGLFLTWPSYVPPFFIPIDHILVSPNANVSQVKIGKFTGSDHLPFVVDCSF